MVDLLIAAGLVALTAIVLRLMAGRVRPQRRYRSAPPVAHRPEPLRRSDFTLTN